MLIDRVEFFSIFADTVVYQLLKKVLVFNYNCEFVYLPFQFYQFLFHTFSSSLVWCMDT